MLYQSPRCWAEIDQNALEKNIRHLQSRGPQVMAVVKANAYGHGINLVVPTLLRHNTQHFAVATVAEAAALRALPGMNDACIYLMAAVLAEEAAEIIRLQVIPFASDTSFVEQLSHAALAQKTTARVHLEVDTGIGRAGIAPMELQRTLERWRSLPGIEVTGICTHFTAADSCDPTDSAGQLAFFEEILSALPVGALSSLAIHAANSPAALRHSSTLLTHYRPGLLLYGIPPSQSFAAKFPYSPVLSLKARVLLVRRLPAGSDISYSRTYRLEREATIATVGIGYGDGFPRRLSSAGRVLLPDGSFALIRGRVCMDQLCVELPDNSSVAPGDSVTLIGRSGENEITVVEIADQIDTTPHEITTCLTDRVERIQHGQPH